MKKLERLRFFILVFLLLELILIPLIKLPLFYLSYEFPKLMVFYGIGIILFFLNSLFFYYSCHLEIPSKKLLITIGSFIFIYFISAVFSISPLVSIFGLREIYTGGLIYTLFLINIFFSAFIVRKDKKIIVQSIVIIAFILSIHSIINYLNHFLFTKELIYRTGANIGNTVRLAFYYLPILFLNLSIFLAQTNKKIKIFFGITLISNILAFCLTFTRSSMFVFAATLIIYLFFLKKEKKRPPCCLLLNKITIFLVLIITFLFFLIALQRTPFDAKSFSKSSFKPRLDEWQAVLKDIINRPWYRIIFGNGPDTIYFTYTKYRQVPKNQSLEAIFNAPLQVRNHYLNLFSSIGFIGLIIYFSLIKKILKNSYFDDSIFFALIAILGNSIFYYQTENVLLLFWVLAGISCISKQKKSNQFYKSKNYLISVLLITLFFIVYFFRFLYAEFLLNIDSSLQGIKKSISLNPYDDIYRYQFASYYLNKSKEFKKSGDIDKAKHNLNLSIRYGKEAVQLAPYDRKNLFFLTQTAFWGGVNLSKKYHQQALFWIDKLIKLDPQNYYLWDQLGQIYLDLGKLDEAMSYFQYVKILNPQMPGVYLHIGEVLKQKGKIKEAIKQYEYALKLYPGWNFALQQLDSAKQLLNNYK